MATPPTLSGSPQGSQLDGPPPQFQPSPGGMPSAGGPPVAGPNPANTPIDPKQFGDGIVKLVSEITKGIDGLSQICSKKAPDTAQYFAQASKNLETGLAMFLSALGWSPSASPTETGDFQGGGFGSSPPPTTPPGLGQ